LYSIGVDESLVTKHVSPFFEELESLCAALAGTADVEAAIQNPQLQKFAITWLQLLPQAERVEIIYRFIETFNKQNEKIFSNVKRYQDLVNSFFSDGNKKLDFTSNGTVIVGLPNDLQRPLTALSSGESHILVILTQLFFNPKRETANILIIDEPELSLHIKWQESFVSAVQTASERLQIILATHSPSIFLDNIDKCVDLS
jgi:predicted ATPase